MKFTEDSKEFNFNIFSRWCTVIYVSDTVNIVHSHRVRKPTTLWTAHLSPSSDGNGRGKTYPGGTFTKPSLYLWTVSDFCLSPLHPKTETDSVTETLRVLTV
jgi:hypothetical protein